MNRPKFTSLIICILILLLCIPANAAEKRFSAAGDMAARAAASENTTNINTTVRTLASADTKEEAPLQPADNAARILVFETTDIHGYLMDTSSGKEDTFQYRLAYIAKVVNDARAAAAENRAAKTAESNNGNNGSDATIGDDNNGNALAAANGYENSGNALAAVNSYESNSTANSNPLWTDIDDVLLLDGGDIYQGTPVSNLLEGSAIRAALDYMDYDAVALGNHEFDWGVTDYNADDDGTIPSYAISDPASSLFLANDPDIPILASNLYYEKNGKRVSFTKDYVIVEKAGYRIALVGYIPDYSDSIITEQIAPYYIDDNLQYLNVLIRIINALEKPDVTIVMTHEEPELIADAMDPKEVDLVTGGHSHESVYGFADNGIPYIQGGCKAQGYATAIINIDSNGNVTVEDPAYTSITNNKSLLYDTAENAGRLDKTVLNISHAAWNELSDKMSEVLGYIDTPIDRTETGDNGSTYAGNWYTGLMLRIMEPYGAVAAFFNSGGIRTELFIPWNQSIRQVTAGDIYTISPFCNVFLLFDITGEELARHLESCLKNESYGNQMSGLTFTYSQSGTEENPKYTVLSITLDNGTEVDIHDSQTIYRICTTDYNSTKRGSILYDKEPVYPEAEAPVDNIAMIEILREMYKENNGYIIVDTGPRGTLVD